MNDIKKLEKKESAEHPKLSKKQIHQIAIDHLKIHKHSVHPHMGKIISDLEENMPEDSADENSEESFPGRDAQKNKFNKMSATVKDDIKAEKGGEYD